jgi:hypothetical protein
MLTYAGVWRMAYADVCWLPGGPCQEHWRMAYARMAYADVWRMLVWRMLTYAGCQVGPVKNTSFVQKVLSLHVSVFVLLY